MSTDEACAAGYAGCSRTATTALLCEREGRRLWMCQSCVTAWRTKAVANPVLLHACPACETQLLDLGRGNAVPAVRPATTPVPLAGVVAAVFERAMFMENVPPDVRSRVLARVRITDGWLEETTGKHAAEIQYDNGLS